MYQRQSSRVASVARAGLAGMCSFIVAFFCVATFMAGCAMLGMSSVGGIEDDPRFSDPFFDHSRKRSRDSRKAQRTAGIILLVISAVLGFITLTLCIIMCRKVGRAGQSTTSQGHVLVSGTGPPPAGYHTQTAGAPPPAPATYPMGPQSPSTYPSQPVYPAPQPGYPPPQQGYPQTQPAGYPPPSGPQYPPAQGYPTGPAYGAGYAFDSKQQGAEPTAPPPPSYQDVVVPGEKQGLP